MCRGCWDDHSDKAAALGSRVISHMYEILICQQSYNVQFSHLLFLIILEIFLRKYIDIS